MPEEIFKLPTELKVHFEMLGHHRRQSDDEINAAAKRTAEHKAQTEDINLIQDIMGEKIQYHDVDVIRIENMNIDQGIARPGGARHWQCKADAIYNIYYTKS